MPAVPVIQPLPSDASTALTKRCEKCRLVAYLDRSGPNAVWTIGWGHTGREVREGLTWTQAQADSWLRRDQMTAFFEVCRLVGQVQLNQGQVDALTDFVFNEGSAHFASSTLLKKLQAKDFAGASNEFLRWDKMLINDVEQDNAELEARRVAERNLFIGVA